MSEPTLSVNTHASISRHLIGAENQPVLVIDDFLDNPEALIDIAVNVKFEQDTGLFPGTRASAPEAYTNALEKALPRLLAESFGTRPGHINRVESSFSLVTQPPETLKPLQRVPHFDSRNPTELASIYFLCNKTLENYGGTAFYRHRSTGFEYIDQPRFARYMYALENDAKSVGLPPANYIHTDTDFFEQIAAFPAVFNRILIYRCTSLHSGIIAADFNFDTNPRTARLSINSFLVS